MGRLAVGLVLLLSQQIDGFVTSSNPKITRNAQQQSRAKERWQVRQNLEPVKRRFKSQLQTDQNIIDNIEQKDKAKVKENHDPHQDGTEEFQALPSISLANYDTPQDAMGRQPTLFDNIDADIVDKIPPFLAEKLVNKGVDSLLPIQAKSFHRIYSGGDVVLQAPTGSGKTLAYILPLVATSKRNKSPLKIAAPVILVLVPSRELARQVGKEFAKYTTTPSNCVTVHGGVPLERHAMLLKKNKPQIVVSTPGRLRELVREGSLVYSQVSTLVLDEADTLLDKGDSPDVRAILKELEIDIGKRQDVPEYQLLLVSATMNQHVVEFAREWEIPPTALVRVEGSDSKVLVTSQSRVLSTNNVHLKVGTVQHWHMSCRASVRPCVAADLISILAPRLTIIFVASKAEAESVASALSTRVVGSVRVLHGDMVQSARSRSIALIREMLQEGGNSQVLVATDVVSRGIDLPVDLVIQFGVPRNAGKSGTFSAELYTHRTGRTGRFTSDGNMAKLASAIMLYDPAEGEGKLVPQLAKEILLELGIEIQPKQLPSSAEVVAAGYARVKEAIALGDRTYVDNDLVRYFRQVIETEKGVETSNPEHMLDYLARTMAMLSNLDPSISPFQPHASLLSGSDADRTLRLFRKDGEAFTPPEVINVCKQWGSGKLGRVVICQDGSAVFDLPHKRAMRLLAASYVDMSRGQLELPTTLPDLCSQ